MWIRANFSVDYDGLGTSHIKNISQYLMKKRILYKSLDSLNKNLLFRRVLMHH